MANPYHDFTANKIDPHGMSSLSQGVGGLAQAFAQQYQAKKQQEDTIKLLMLKSQIEQSQALAQEKAKQQAIFDMQGQQIERARKMYPEMFSGSIGAPINQDMNFNPLRGMQDAVSSSVGRGVSRGTNPIDVTADKTNSMPMGEQFNPVKSAAPSPFIMQADPMNGSIKQVKNPAYERSEKPPTAGQETTALYASRISQANKIFDNLERYINNLPVVGTALSGIAPNFMRDKNYQSYDQAKRNFVNAVLRRESGAVISPTEFENANQQYFPQPGDKPEVIEQKRLNRDLVMKNFIKSSGKAYVPYEEPGGRGTSKQLDQNTAREILKQAGGDKNKARELAKQQGFIF